MTTRAFRENGLLLAVIIAVALALRLWWLDRAPPGLDSDEVSIAYNAYSIARTGRDEYGELLPTAFRAFGEYKRPAFIYFSAPFLALLGPTPFAARLPGAIAGTLTVLVVYLLGSRLTRSASIGLLAAAFVAISPWSLQFSRGAREVSLFLLALSVMVLCLLKPQKQSSARSATLWIVSAALAFLLALYSYPGGVVVAPLLALAVLATYPTRMRRHPRTALAAGALVLMVGFIPLAAQLRDGRATARAAQTSLLSQEWIITQAEGKAARSRQELPPPLASLATVMDNRWAIVGREVARAYLAHLDPRFLFTDGDPEPRHHPPGVAQLYLWDAPVLLLGMAVLARCWRRSAYRLLAAWLMIAPLPSALAENAPHAVRSFAMLPPLAVIAALGARRAWWWLGRRGFAGQIGRGMALALPAGSLAFYLKAYYRDYPLEHDRAWSSGWIEAFQLAKREVDQGRARSVVVPPEVREGYVYALFASGYDPRRYLDHGGSAAHLDWALYPQPGPMRFPPWEVRRVEWQTESRSEDTLYVLGSWNQLPPGARVLATTRGAGGRPALQLISLANS